MALKDKKKEEDNNDKGKTTTNVISKVLTLSDDGYIYDVFNNTRELTVHVKCADLFTSLQVVAINKNEKADKSGLGIDDEISSEELALLYGADAFYYELKFGEEKTVIFKVRSMEHAPFFATESPLVEEDYLPLLS
ncbi:MAG: hypothetical protein D6769_01260 [Methanobacteriota archaeon]|nr:MAG: hypothetical protein D6769_01260 [Euryarchaeota archaeon]